MLARYKKAGGITGLCKLIESSAEPKKSQLLKMIRAEDPQFAGQVEGRLLTWNKLKSLPESYMAEVVGNTPPKHLALALTGEDESFRTLCEKCLGSNFGPYKEEKEALIANMPTPGSIESGRTKMLSEARKLEASGAIKLDALFSGAPVTGDALRAPSSSGDSSAPSGDPLKTIAEAGADSDPNQPPPIESFKMEPPPPGLMGERFETFVKQNLH